MVKTDIPRGFPRGFTLVELMVVMVIIAVLASYAVPGYQRYVMMGRLEEAKAMILAIEARQKIYYNQNGGFYPYKDDDFACGTPFGSIGLNGTSETDIRQDLGVDLRESRNFKYRIYAGRNGDCDGPADLDIGATDHWFRVVAEIVAPGGVDADKGDMTLEPEWTSADDTVLGSGPMTEAGRYLIYEYPHRTDADYATADDFVEEGWDNGFNPMNIFDQTVNTLNL